MCGIFGYVATRPSFKNAPIIQQGLYVDSLRGMCGTGIYAADLKRNEAFTYKRALTGQDFVNSRQYEMFKKKIDAFQVVIGHNRASTIGDARDEHCHPFLFDGVGFVHNGTLRDYRSLVKDKDFEHGVDSAWAAKAMSEAQDPVDVLTKVQGPYVFVWHDMNRQTFNITRNNNRDIWFVLDKDYDNLYFASEFGMLNWILQRNGVDVGNNKFRSPKEHTLIQWDLTKPFNKQPKVIAYEEYQPPKFVDRYRGNGNYNWHARMLDEFDLEDREEILCSADGWNAYSNYPAEPNPRGTVTGKIVAPNTKHHGLEFVMHGISKTEGVTWLDEKLFIAEVVSVQKVWRGEGSTDLVKLTVINPSKRNPKGGETDKPDLKKLEDIVEMFPGPDGVLLTYKEWQHEVQGGCVYCSDPIDPRDAKHIVWVGWAGADDNPVCLACQNNPDTRSEMMNWGIELPLREVKGNA